MPAQSLLRITVLGCGTSTGVPMPGCACDVCNSPDEKNRRLRCSLLIQYSGKNILVDAGPDLRAQALRANIQHVDAVIFTHSHADHILGIDDLRPFNFKQGGSIPCYGTRETLEQIRRVFHYVFDRDPNYMGGLVSELTLNEIDYYESFELFGLRIEPFLLLHGNTNVAGLKIGNFAYATDCKVLPAKTKSLLTGIDTLILDGLRHRDHSTHLTIDEALAEAAELNAGKVFLTHMSHSIDYTIDSAKLPKSAALCFDGMTLEFNY